MNMSLNTLMLAIKAIERDIKTQEKLAQDDALSDEDSDYYGQYVLDLTQALSELAGLYQIARVGHPECPTLEELVRPSQVHFSLKRSTEVVKMLPRVIEARHVSAHTIWLRFSDGAEGEVDLSQELHGEVFEPLKDVEYFRKFQVHPDLRTLVWPNGADFATEFLRSSLRFAA